MSDCIPCFRGFHWECVSAAPHKPKKCKCVERALARPVAGSLIKADVNETKKVLVPKDAKSNRENIIDPHSTGRKRAAELYPFSTSMPCEWRELKECGGGLRPIIGCLNGLVKHRHHGPVKDTLRNHLGNVHRICVDCHIHWHELNDLIYSETQYRLLPHDPIPATPEELAKNFAEWKTGEMGRRFELASSKNAEKGRLKLDD
jgi:hypothetical protein